MVAKRKYVPELNKGVVDEWTLPHFGAGCFMGAMKLTPGQAFMLAVGWELIEEPLRPYFFTGSANDCFENKVMDVIVAMVGYGVTVAISDSLNERRKSGQRRY